MAVVLAEFRKGIALKWSFNEHTLSHREGYPVEDYPPAQNASAVPAEGWRENSTSLCQVAARWTRCKLCTCFAAHEPYFLQYSKLILLRPSRLTFLKLCPKYQLITHLARWGKGLSVRLRWLGCTDPFGQVCLSMWPCLTPHPELYTPIINSQLICGASKLFQPCKVLC